MQAIMGSAALLPQPSDSLPGLSPIGGGEVDPTLPPMDNPFTAMLFPQGQGMGASMGNGVAPDMAPPAKLQRLMPFLHLGMIWCLLAYFVLWVEPRVYGERHLGGEFGVWSRWTELGKNRQVGAVAQMLQIQVVVSSFYVALAGVLTGIGAAFLLGIHDSADCIAFSADIFRFCEWCVNCPLSCSTLDVQDAVQPPTIISFALPHLPPQASSIVMNTLKYLQMGSLFLDDLSGLVVGLGFIVWFSGWFAA